MVSFALSAVLGAIQQFLFNAEIYLILPTWPKTCRALHVNPWAVPVLLGLFVVENINKFRRLLEERAGHVLLSIPDDREECEGVHYPGDVPRGSSDGGTPHFCYKIGLMSGPSQDTAKITIRSGSRILRCLRGDLARIKMGDEPQKGLAALGPH